jgi:hypothetical protein
MDANNAPQQVLERLALLLEPQARFGPFSLTNSTWLQAAVCVSKELWVKLKDDRDEVSCCSARLDCTRGG